MYLYYFICVAETVKFNYFRNLPNVHIGMIGLQDSRPIIIASLIYA